MGETFHRRRFGMAAAGFPAASFAAVPVGAAVAVPAAAAASASARASAQAQRQEPATRGAAA
jgi:hypothetical protein